ncbi:uncharacterized protein TNCV_1834861 [Trichonephila clavipes]|nr:uncharacterized protein TNCV_1834861 [Trichonephila clavipes]
MLSETWLDNDERVSIPNFDCCVQFKQPGRRAAGVAIYRKQKNSHVVTPHMNITYRQTSGLGIVSNRAGARGGQARLMPGAATLGGGKLAL